MRCCTRRWKAQQQAIVARDNQDQGPSAVWFLCILHIQLSGRSYVWGVERRIKTSLLGLCDSAVPSFSACYPLTLTLQTTLFTLLLHQCVWGSFAMDLFRHLSQALCCKITSYLEICMKKKAFAKSNTENAQVLLQTWCFWRRLCWVGQMCCFLAIFVFFFYCINTKTI